MLARRISFFPSCSSLLSRAKSNLQLSTSFKSKNRQQNYVCKEISYSSSNFQQSGGDEKKKRQRKNRKRKELPHQNEMQQLLAEKKTLLVLIKKKVCEKHLEQRQTAVAEGRKKLKNFLLHRKLRRLHLPRKDIKKNYLNFFSLSSSALR